MKNRNKSVISMILAILVLVSCTFVVSAREVAFEKKLVDSNSYGIIAGAIKETTSETAAILITNIYKADGSSSSYKAVYVKAMDSGAVVTARKGTTCDVTIPPASRAAGSYVNLYAMGRDPSLDCKISGYWNVH